MSETRERYDAGATRACFNCESGTMARTADPEPGWYCARCDTFEPDDQTRPRPGLDFPELESVITQRLTFADGSEIIVTVKAPRGERGPGLLEQDLASRH